MKINIDFYPIKSGINPYIEIMRELLEKQLDCNIKEFVYSEKYYLKNKKHTDIVYMNWYDNIQTTNTIRTLIRAIRRIELLCLIKKCKIKIVIVIHNRIPHNTKNIKLISWFSKEIYKIADKVVILSGGTIDVLKKDFGEKYYKKIENKISVVPHPNYYNVYPEKNIDFRNIWNVKKDDFVYLFFGNISPYKNVEVFIEAAQELSQKVNKAKFVIMGNCNNDYKKKLASKIGQNDNILLITREIENAELTSVIKSSNIVVMPFDKKSSLNSTTLFLALSCGVNVICSRIACVTDFSGKLYDYDYSDYVDHRNELVNMCEKAYEEFFDYPDTYRNRLNEIENKLKTDHEKVAVGKKLANVIRNVVS